MTMLKQLVAETHPTMDEWVYYAIWETENGKFTEQISFDKWVSLGSVHPYDVHELSNQIDPDGVDPWSKSELRMEYWGEEEYEESEDEE